MDIELIGIFERMGYKVDIDKDTLEMRLLDENNEELKRREYEIWDPNEKKFSVVRYYGKKDQRISVYSNNILDVKVNRFLSIIVDCNEKTNINTIEIKVEYPKSKYSDLKEKTIRIKTCPNQKNGDLGYVVVYEDNLINDEVETKKLGSFEQKRAYFTLNGKKDNMYSNIYTTDNYLDAVLNIICSEREIFTNKHLHEGVDIIIPVLYEYLDKLLVYWLNNISECYQDSLKEKDEIEKEIKILNEKLRQHIGDITEMEDIISCKDDIKRHRKVQNHNSMFLID